MTCNNCKTKPVWKFTNQTQLCKKCFLDYIERKVFKTIRKFHMISNNEILLKKDTSLNYQVLKSILEQKFPIKNKSGLTTENLSQLAEIEFSEILKGNFIKQNLSNKPLSQISDQELELYAKLKNIKGKTRKKNPEIRDLFEKFMKKNQDLEINVLNAMEQL